MSNETAPTRDTDNDASPTSAVEGSQSTLQPWISRLAVITCIGIYVGIAAQNDYGSWDTLSRFGYLPADSVWDGAYWALISSAFVHIDLWHVAFNVYWLWVLGRRLEQAIGSLPFLGFFLASAFVSSSFQLAVSDGTGFGASGVVYAIFGFMWPTRHRYPPFNRVLDARTILIFLLWLAGCVITTYLQIWDVGNAAHISGLLFGCTVAGYFVLYRKSRLMLAGLVALIGLSIVPLFWCPWSVTWLSGKAYDAHVAERYEEAIDGYTRVIVLDPDDAWAYANRASAHEALGDSDKAQADLKKAREIDPSIENTE